MKEYSNEEITIVWKSDLCTHSKKCWQGLINVFNPDKRPWININGASTDKVVAQVKQCPSKALTYYFNDIKEKGDSDNKKESSPDTDEVDIEMVQDGPLVVYGNVGIKDKDGNIFPKRDPTILCRCGQSRNKPYCDGSHVDVNFKS
jgi:uncharacterized Fe-S cluster protein YjdI